MPIVAAEIRRKLEDSQHDLAILEKEVKDVLLGLCDRKGYAFSSRRKSLESLSEKLESGRYRSWSQIDDLFACSIVVSRRAEIAATVEFLKQQFQVQNTKQERDDLNPTMFEFGCTRVYATLKRSDDPKVTLPITMFEVQVKTAFEHAWVTTTHGLVDKSDSVDWRRQRLAAQMKANVEQLDTIVDSFDSITKIVPLIHHKETETKQTVVRWIMGLLEEGHVPQEHKPKDYSRFADNLLNLLEKKKLTANLDRVLQSVKERIESFGDKFPMSLSLFQIVSHLVLETQNIDPSTIKGFSFIYDENTSILLGSRLDISANSRFDFR